MRDLIQTRTGKEEVMFVNYRGIAAASVGTMCLCAANADGVNLSISNYYASY